MAKAIIYISFRCDQAFNTWRITMLNVTPVHALSLNDVGDCAPIVIKPVQPQLGVYRLR
jgi:hypothetical protein